MVLYLDLLPEEQEKLERIDGDVFRHVLNRLGRTERPIWCSRSGDGLRYIRLCLADAKGTRVMEMTADELSEISQEALLAKLELLLLVVDAGAAQRRFSILGAGTRSQIGLRVAAPLPQAGCLVGLALTPPRQAWRGRGLRRRALRA